MPLRFGSFSQARPVKISLSLAWFILENFQGPQGIWRGPWAHWTYLLQILSKLCFQRMALSRNYEIVAISTDKNTFLNDLDHGQRTSRESFFSKIRNFLAWADKLGWNFGGHFGYFQPNYWHYFGTVSLLFMGKCSWIFFLQKTLVFRSKTYNSQKLPK